MNRELYFTHVASIFDLSAIEYATILSAGCGLVERIPFPFADSTEPNSDEPLGTSKSTQSRRNGHFIQLVTGLALEARVSVCVRVHHLRLRFMRAVHVIFDYRIPLK